MSQNRHIEFTNIDPEKLTVNTQNRKCPYDIFITDIDMGSLNGIDLVNEINQINPQCIIIFVSNYIHYATKVYDVEHIYSLVVI